LIAYLAASLTGAWRLARLKPDGFGWFDLSADGFWRSFLAMPVVMPLFLGFVAVQAGAGPVNWAGYFFVEVLGYALAWCAFLALMVPFARFFGLGPGYVPFVVAYNWAQVLILMLLLPPTLLRAAGVMPGFMTVVIAVLLTLAILYIGLLARLGLRTDWPQTVAVVLIEMVTSYAIRELVDFIF
jgi:hypothetical protein